MHSDTNIPCDAILRVGGSIKEQLCRSNFYSPDKLDYLTNLLTNEDPGSGFISSYKVDYPGKTIQIQYRQIYIKKHPTEERYNSTSFYNQLYITLNKFYDHYRSDLMTIIGPEKFSKFFNQQIINDLFFINRIGENTLIISFV